MHQNRNSIKGSLFYFPGIWQAKTEFWTNVDCWQQRLHFKIQLWLQQWNDVPYDVINKKGGGERRPTNINYASGGLHRRQDQCQLHICSSHQLCKSYCDCDTKMHVYPIHKFTAIWLFYLALCVVNTQLFRLVQNYTVHAMLTSLTLSRGGEGEKYTYLSTRVHCRSLQPFTAGMKVKPGTDSCSILTALAHYEVLPTHIPPI
jgi:hypothetical protein